MDLRTQWGRERAGRMEKVAATYIYIYIYTLACVKWMVAERLLITQAASQSGALWWPRGWNGGGEGVSRGRWYVYIMTGNQCNVVNIKNQKNVQMKKKQKQFLDVIHQPWYYHCSFSFTNLSRMSPEEQFFLGQYPSPGLNTSFM